MISKRLIIAWIKKKLKIASPTLFYGDCYMYEFDYLIEKLRKRKNDRVF